MTNFLNKLDNIKVSLTFDDVLIKPRMSNILPAQADISIVLNKNVKLELPVLSAAMDTVTEYEMSRTMTKFGGCGPLHKNSSFEYLIESVKKLKAEALDGQPCAVSVGVNTDKQEIAEFVKAGANVIIVDSAHGHSENVGLMVEHIKQNYPDVFLVAGNVVTKEGALFLISKGADAIKVGIGPGSICITRKVTGVGVGQLSAIAEVAAVCKPHNVLTIADGGIRSLDEIMKSIVVGADMVMLGYMLAGTDECPGKMVEFNGTKYKPYRGMGCINAMKEGSSQRYNKDQLSQSKWISEGIEGFVKAKGSVNDVLHNIKWGLKTAFGYLGARNISEVHQYAEVVQITNSVLKKSNIHSIEKVVEEKL